MDETATDPDLKLAMRSCPRLLAAARAMVGNFCQRLGFNEVQCGQVSLAIDEALCNIINHGYGRRPDGQIWISVWSLTSGDPGVKVVLEDRATQVDPETIRPRDLDDIRPGGLGVYIIREIMDGVTYEQRSGGGMRMTMVKRIPAREAAETAVDGSSPCESDEKNE